MSTPEDDEEEEGRARSRPAKAGTSENLTGPAVARFVTSTSDLIDGLNKREGVVLATTQGQQVLLLELYREISKKQDRIAELQGEIAEIRRQDQGIQAKTIEAEIEKQKSADRVVIARDLLDTVRQVVGQLGVQFIHEKAQARVHTNADLTWAEDISVHVTVLLKALMSTPDGEAMLRKYGLEVRDLVAVIKAYREQHGAPQGAAPAPAPQAEQQ